MVYMSHDAYNRRPFHHQAFIFFVLFQEFLNDIHNFFFLAENVKVHCNLFCSVKINLLIHGNHFSLKEKLLDDH